MNTNMNADQLFLPRRLLSFADGGTPESYAPGEGGEAAAGVSEEAVERAAEERRQSQAAAKQQRREERKFKKRDDKLADMILMFIQGSQRDETLAILLSRLYERNTPSAILLAVLSLNYPDMVTVLENYLLEESEIIPDDTPDAFVTELDTTALVEYGKELSESLREWTNRIMTHASFRPMKSIYALALHHGVDQHMLKLTALMIQRYFMSMEREIEWERIHDFAKLFWTDTLKKLHRLASERGILPSPEKDPMAEEEMEDEEDDEE